MNRVFRVRTLIVCGFIRLDNNLAALIFLFQKVGPQARSPCLMASLPALSMADNRTLRSASRAQHLPSREPSAANSRARVKLKEGQDMLSPALGQYRRPTKSHPCALAIPFNFQRLALEAVRCASAFSVHSVVVPFFSRHSPLPFSSILISNIFLHLQIPFSATPFFSHLYKSPGYPPPISFQKENHNDRFVR